MNQNLLPPLLLAALILLSGCGLRAAPSAPLTLEGSSTVLSAGDFVDTDKAEVLSLEALIASLPNTRVIYIGENHVSLANHKIQQEIMAALYRESPDLTIAMEMFPRSVQPALDEWTIGALSEEAFLAKANWKDNWGYPFRLYRSIFNFARDKRLKIVGLNAPQAIVKKVARKGIAGLSDEEKRLIAQEMDRENPEHRAFLREVYEIHSPDAIKDFETFYESQLTWDETMAESIATLLSSTENRGKIVVLAGNGHVSYRFGIPERAARRVPHRYVVVASVPVNTPRRPIDRRIGDYIWVLPEEPAHPPRGRIGVLIRQVEGGEGMEILKVVPKSNAHRAGILKGDIFLTINNSIVNDMESLHRAMAGKGPDHEILIRRDEQQITVKLTIRKESE